VPPGFGTHSEPLQQLALDAHALPGPTHCNGAQRLTPLVSGRHVLLTIVFPAQQSVKALQEVPVPLHTAPSGLQLDTRQTPMVAGGVIAHVTGVPGSPGSPAAPQQSPSLEHASPGAWHPVAALQT
jgi:hypothetical protein